ncbi:hypothetical protein [Pseudomonas sp.]|uniref:hypothetical protein n=1 Tax=Pseudomonas sp. TaxID=306 RepID=UPI003D6EF5CF
MKLCLEPDALHRQIDARIDLHRQGCRCLGRRCAAGHRRLHARTADIEVEQTTRTEVAAKRELLERAREAAKTMTLDEAYRALGMSRTELHRMTKEAGFYFQSNDKEHKAREVARQAKAEERAKLVELIRANSGIGLSRNFVAKKLGISNHTLVKLAEENGIDFPRWSDRP